MCAPSRDLYPQARTEKTHPSRTRGRETVYERDRHLGVPRKHVERIVVGDDRDGGSSGEE
jgi:hypothetical protein